MTQTYAGHSDWRLPTQNELQTLIEYSIAYPGPTINSTIFPTTPASDFWSASAEAGYSAFARYVYFSKGSSNSLNKGRSIYVRLVRGGQSLGSFPTPPTVSNITPTTATLNQLTQFTVTGANLTSGMGFTIENCEYPNIEVGTGSTTARTFECTPQGTTGVKKATVKTAPGGTTLYSFSVNVADLAIAQASNDANKLRVPPAMPGRQ